MSWTKMSEILVLYKSKYGSSKQCAEWLASELGADIFESSSPDAGAFEKYSTIVHCSGIYRSSINGLKVLLKNPVALKGKKIAVVACGFSGQDNKEYFEKVKGDLYQSDLYKKLPQEQKENVQLFLLRGGINYSTLSLGDKAMLKMVEKILRAKKSETLTAEDRQILEVLGKDTRFSIDRASIESIINYCK